MSFAAHARGCSLLQARASKRTNKRTKQARASKKHLHDTFQNMVVHLHDIFQNMIAYQHAGASLSNLPSRVNRHCYQKQTCMLQCNIFMQVTMQVSFTDVHVVPACVDALMSGRCACVFDHVACMMRFNDALQNGMQDSHMPNLCRKQHLHALVQG